MWCAHGVLQFRDANMSCGETAAKIAKQSDWQQGRCLQDPASGSAWALVMCSWRLLLFAHFTRKLSWLTSYKWWLLKYHGAQCFVQIPHVQVKPCLVVCTWCFAQTGLTLRGWVNFTLNACAHGVGWLNAGWVDLTSAPSTRLKQFDHVNQVTVMCF